jgi:hypothetical protein
MTFHLRCKCPTILSRQNQNGPAQRMRLGSLSGQISLRYSAGSDRNVPRRSARSFSNTKKTGTRIST